MRHEEDFFNKKQKPKYIKHKKSLSKDELITAINYINDCNDIYAFEKYCGSCDNFNTENCPFYNKVCNDTEWKEIHCQNYWN